MESLKINIKEDFTYYLYFTIFYLIIIFDGNGLHVRANIFVCTALLFWK